MQPSLTTLLSYQNENVISRYERDYPDSRMKGEEAFRELMKYIWLSCKHHADIQHSQDDHTLQFSCSVHSEMVDVDNMWHTFLLFTRDYQAFCREYLGNMFFHHEPATSKDESSKEQYKLELSRYLSYIYDHLGEETLLKWFDER